jgi:hypothetical protein
MNRAVEIERVNRTSTALQPLFSKRNCNQFRTSCQEQPIPTNEVWHNNPKK